ncbi:MAG TPA: RNA polymerase factor sigma-54 [Alphaproteobacteria bacterium]|nr:RNA polymerase factor sigma-54 [Alphaproteobacteria bacterium]
MALSQRLDIRQSQSLVMTPQLQQAIKLLQLSNVELSEYVEGELEQNPLLERDDGPADGGDGDIPALDGPDPREEGPAPADSRLADTVELTRNGGTAGDAPLDTDFSNVWTNSAASDLPADAVGSVSPFANGGGFDEDGPGFEASLTRPPTLREHLLEQMGHDLALPAERLIALDLIDMLDGGGYLVGDLGEVAERLGCGLPAVEAVLAKLQRFDPPGIFARSLAECLALQLREKDRLDPCMRLLLDNLELLGSRNLPALMKACDCDAEDLAGMIAEIRALNPKPALLFDHELAQPVTPDILMRPDPAGGWIVELNAETLPRVLVNRRYYAQVSAGARGRQERDYLTERFNSANWLVKSLHQRATTILRVASEIVRQQDGFFRHGVQHLRPLVLRNIAEAIEMHESTVSRVTTNKYLATPRGIYELKYFFTSAIAGADGQAAHSAEAVRHRIKALIDSEEAKSVLSDDQIVETLRKDGIDIARRTVAKYREAMGIPSSVERRRQKSLQRLGG